MKNYVFSLAVYLKKVLIEDFIIRYLFLISLLFGISSYFLWEIYLTDTYVYTRILIYPVQYLALIFLINTFLAIISYIKEKEISYLFFIGNVIVGTLVIILELFYIYIYHS